MELDVELLDVVLESSSKVVLLVSYAGVDDENSMMVSNNPRRIYALIRFSHTANAFAAEDAIVVPYQSVSVFLFSPPFGNSPSHSDLEFRCTHAPPDSICSRWGTDRDPIRRCHCTVRSRFVAMCLVVHSVD